MIFFRKNNCAVNHGAVFVFQNDFVYLFRILYPIVTAQIYIQVFGSMSIPIIGLTSDHRTTGR